METRSEPGSILAPDSFLPSSDTKSGNPDSPSSSQSIPTYFTEEQIQAAKNVVKEVGPRVYELVGFNSDEVLIYVFGCQGDPGKGQHQVAKMMSEAALRKKPALIIMLGDYTYPYAMTSPNDSRFQTHFYDLYAHKKNYPGIADVPMIGTLGNHDGNYYKGFTSFIYKGDAVAKALRYEVGEEAELNFLANTFLIHRCDSVKSHNRKEIYTSRTIHIDQLPKCDVPYFFHSRIIGNKQFFFINTNSLALDYLRSNQGTDPNNQIIWLKREYKIAKAAGKEIIFVQHQPLNAFDKRARESGGDAGLYFPPDESESRLQDFAQLFSLPTVTRNYGRIVKRIYERLGLIPDLLLCAHHHCLSSYNCKKDSHQTFKFCQVTSGAAGGKLQERESFSHYDDVFYLESYGYVELSFNKANREPMRYALVTQSARLEFTTESKRPIVHSKYNPAENRGTDDNLADIIRRTVLEACDDYQIMLENRQDPEDDREYGGLFGKKRFHLPLDVPHLHNIMAYLLKPEPDKLEILIIRLCSMMNDMTPASDLYREINNKLRQLSFIGMSLQELRDEYSIATQPRF